MKNFKYGSSEAVTGGLVSDTWKNSKINLEIFDFASEEIKAETLGVITLDIVKVSRSSLKNRKVSGSKDSGR